MTYKEIKNKAKEDLGITIKTCWIADVKRELGLTSRLAYNRITEDKVKYPCPEGEVKDWLLNIFKIQ